KRVSFGYFLRMKSNDVEVVFESDIEIEPAFIGARFRRRELVQPVFELFLPHESRKRVQRRVVLGHLKAFARNRMHTVLMRHKIRPSAADEEHPSIARVRPFEKRMEG